LIGASRLISVIRSIRVIRAKQLTAFRVEPVLVTSSSAAQASQLNR
jgi:hypothetical protein